MTINTERFMREQDFIVSKTDLTGRILYGNETFIEFSGYEEEELLGQPQNIIRHPDMPRLIFKLLWDCITNDKEIFAFVKNSSKDGGFYWVFAQVAPTFNRQQQKIGYTSVRRMPNPKAIPSISELYEKMLMAERQANAGEEIAASTAVLNEFLTKNNISYDFLVTILQAR
ncbi:MAG: PAS domain-containing protein [Methylococcaceae bacterium]|jgi:PAS domain S-box-containing protein